MITLHKFGPMFGLPDPSPFVTKTEVLLKMSGVPFESTVKGLRGAPKGKLPFIEDDDAIIADSTFIRIHLEQKHGVDFDRDLSATEKGFAWSVEKMLEDHFYWVMLYWRWMIDVNFEKGPANFFKSIPAPLRGFITRMVRSKVRKSLHTHGLGRHTTAEIATLGNRAIDALAAVLSDKPYLMGLKPCGADATAFAFVIGALCPHFDTPIGTRAAQHANLVAYGDRLSREFYPAK